LPIADCQIEPQIATQPTGNRQSEIGNDFISWFFLRFAGFVRA
jgi:hypothetical protein